MLLDGEDDVRYEGNNGCSGAMVQRLGRKEHVVLGGNVGKGACYLQEGRMLERLGRASVSYGRGRWFSDRQNRLIVAGEGNPVSYSTGRMIEMIARGHIHSREGHARDRVYVVLVEA